MRELRRELKDRDNGGLRESPLRARESRVRESPPQEPSLHERLYGSTPVANSPAREAPSSEPLIRDSFARDILSPGETLAMRVPPRNRWQVLLMEYEMLDSLQTQINQRIWLSGLFLVGLTMVGLTFLATGLRPNQPENLHIIALIGGIASLLNLGWWLVLRRLTSIQRVSEYRKQETERELGIRSELYLGFLHQSRLFGLRRAGTIARYMAEGDTELEKDLVKFSKAPGARPWFPRFMAERFVWSLVPWVLITGWAGLYVMKMGLLKWGWFAS